jgi:hypothetical protein
MGTAANTANQATKELADGVDVNMREARGSVMLLEHEIGIKLPREMNTLIASIPGVGAAFEAILPALAAVFIVKKVYDFIEATKAAQEALSQGFGKSIQETATRSDELKLSIAETQLKIDKLLGKPISGDALAVELAKARVEADKMAASLTKDLDELIKLMDKGAHGALMTALLGTSGSGQAADVMKGLRDEIAKIPKDAADYNEQAAAATKRAWDRAASELKKNNDTVNSQMESIGSESGGIVTNFTAANRALQETQEKLSGIYDGLDLQTKKTAGDKNLVDVTAAVTAAKEQSKANELRLESGKKTADSLAEYYSATAKAQYESGKATLDQEVDAEKVAAQMKLDAERTFIAGKIALEKKSTDPGPVKAERLKELNDQLKDTTEFDKKIVEIDAGAAKKKLEIWQSANTKQIEQGMRYAKENYDIVQRDADNTLAVAKEEAKNTLAVTEEANRHKVATGRMTNQEQMILDAQAHRTELAAEVAAINARQKALVKGDKDYLKEMDKFDKEKKALLDKSTQDEVKDQDKANEEMIAGYKKVQEQFASAVAKQIVEGKGLGKAMESMAKEMAENFIKNCLMMKLPSAKSAADKAAAATPGPPPAQTIAWVETFASLMALEQGGPTLPGESYLIGEKGPEIWTAGASGFVTPNDQLAKVGTSAGNNSHHNGNITMQIATPDANSFKKSQSQIQAKAHHAQATAKRRNG